MSPYAEAYFQLSQAVSAYQSHPASTVHQDAVLYNFIQAFDAAIQALAEYLESEGVLVLNPSPRGVLKEAFAAGCFTRWRRLERDAGGTKSTGWILQPGNTLLHRPPSCR